MRISQQLLYLLARAGDTEAQATVKMMEEDQIAHTEVNVVFTSQPWEMYYLEPKDEVAIPLTRPPRHLPKRRPTLLGLSAMINKITPYPSPQISVIDSDGGIDTDD